MKTKLTIIVLGLFCSFQLLGQNTLDLNVGQATTKIKPELYGHFSEHLGTCIYGGIYVGKNSKIPNINGYRTDVVNALKEMKIPVLRWPGGCFADTYHWKDGIGPQEKRPSIVNVHWGGVTEDNSFGTHEFLDFCELIGTEPYLSINVGSGSVEEATEWVEYVSSSNESPMTELRKKNGREDPWKVKFWGIGNETWGCGGDMRPEYYADVYRNYSCYIRGNDLMKIAVGPSGDDYNWTEKMMDNLQHKKNLVQGLSLHYYTLPTGDWGAKGSSTNFGEEQWFETLKRTLFVEDYIKKHLAIMDKYDSDKRIGLAVDEWGTWYDPLPGSNPGFLQQQNTLRDALVAGVNLNLFNNHADRIVMANIAQVINVLQSVIMTKEDKMVLTPTYYVFKMYNVHQGATLVPSALKCEDYEFKGEKIPSVNASSSIKDGVLSITLCNMNPNKSEIVSCNLTGGQEYKTITGKIINAQSITDYNDFGQPEKVGVKDFSVSKPKGGKLSIELPAHSVVLVQLQ